MTRPENVDGCDRPIRAGVAISNARAIGAWLTVGIALTCLATAGGSMTTTDAVLAFDVTRNMVEHGSIATTDERLQYAAYRGRDDHYYSPFGIAQSVWNIPFYFAGRTAAAALKARPGPPDTLPKAAVALATIPAVAFLAWACFGLLLELDAEPVRAARSVLLLVLGTPLWPYSGFGFNQPLAGMFLWLALFSAIRAARHGQPAPILAGSFAGLATLTRHEMILAAAIVGLWIAVSTERRRSVAVVSYLGGLFPFVALWCGLNWWRFGDPLESGYLRDATPQFGSSILAGAAGFLFSPYASLFLYCPLAVIGVLAFPAMWRHNRKAAGLTGLVFLAFFVLYASLGNWMGGRSYGPRYLVPLLPTLSLPFAFWAPAQRMRRIAVAILLLSVAVQIPGVLVDYSKVREERAAAGATVAQDMRWAGMPLYLNARALTQLSPRTVRHLTGLERRPEMTRDVPLAVALSSGVDVWWVHLFYLGIMGRWSALMLGLTLAVSAVAALLRAFALARACSPVR